MINNQLEINGIIIELIRKPIKNMHLRIYPPNGDVKVSAPLKLPIKLIRQQLESRSAWIQKQRNRFRTSPPATSAKFETGEQHYFLGKPYTLTVKEQTRAMKIIFDNESLHCLVKSNSTEKERQLILLNWYRQEMNAYLPALIAKWEPIIGVNVAAWGIKIMKTRWGSCNTHARRIWLNLNLIKKPLSCLEYVLVHEMIHILEASHNKRFYMLMEKFLPQWRETQKQLEESQPVLCESA